MAGNNVGSLVVDVDIATKQATVTFVKQMKKAGDLGADVFEASLNNVNTKKIEARLRLFSAKAAIILEQTGIEIDYDFQKAERKLELAKAKIEAKEADVPLTIDDRKLIAAFEAAKIKLEAQIKRDAPEIRLNTRLDERLLQVTLAKLKQEVESRPLLKKLRLDFDKASKAQLEKYIKIQEATPIQLDVEINAELDSIDLAKERAQLQVIVDSWDTKLPIFADLDKASLAQVRKLAELAGKIDWEVNLELDAALANAQLAALRLRVEKNPLVKNIQLDITKASAAQLRAYIALQEATPIEKEVKLKTSKFTKPDLGRLPSDMTKVFLSLGLIAGDALISGAAGAISAGTAVISSAAQGLVGALAPSVAIIGGLVGVLGAVVVGSQGFGKALSAMSKELESANEEGRLFDLNAKDVLAALNNLAPEAREAALAFGSMRVEIGEIRKEVQGNLFSGLGKEIASLSDRSGKAESTIEDFGEFLGLAADSANRFIEGLIGIAESTDFAGTFTAIQPAVDAILDTILTLVDTFEPFLLAAAPAAEDLARYLSKTADALNAWTTDNAERIAEILVDGVKSLEAWFGLLGNVGGLLADIFSAGQQSGDGFIVKLDEIITRFRTFLTDNEGKRLQDFFEFGERAASAFKPVLVGLGDALKVLTSADAEKSFASLAEQIGETLPVFAELLLQIGQLEILQSALLAVIGLATGIGALAEALGPAAKYLGLFVVAISITAKLNALVTSLAFLGPALKAVGVAAYKALGPIGLFVVAVAAITTALYFYAKQNEDLNNRTKELIPNLRIATNELIAETDAANAATVGFDALTQVLLDTGDGGDKLRYNLGLLKVDTEDVISVLESINSNKGDSDSRVASLAKLAAGMGVTGEAALELAGIVDRTDDNFTQVASRGYNDVGTALQAIADSSGIAFDDLVRTAKALEELQDQAENTDIDRLAQEFIQYEGSLNKTNIKLLEQAELNTGLKRDGENLFPLYEELTRLMALNSVALDVSAQLKQEEINTLALYAEANNVAAIAAKELTDKLAIEAEVALALTRDALGPLSERLQKMTEKLEAGAEKATAFKIRLDALIPTAFGVDGALDGAQKAINELVESIVDGDDKFVGFEELLKGTSTAAIDQRAALRDTASEIFSYAEAALEGGVGAGQAALKVDELSESLAAQLVELGLNEQEIQALLAQYGLTPDQINTVFGSNAVQQKGLVDEYVGAAEGALGIIKTTFTADGLDPSTGLVARSLDDFVGGLDDLNGRIITTDIETPTIADVKAGVNDLDIAFDNLPPTTDLSIEIPGLDEDIIGVDTLATAIFELPNSKTIYINTVYSSSGNVGSSGNGPTSGNSGGGDFFSSTAPTNTSNVTNHFNISGTSDAHAVATQVANRSALAVM